MEPRRLISPGLLLTVLLVLAPTVASAASLQDQIDATPAGGTLRLAPGSYVAPVTIKRPMTLDGGGKARIVGSGYHAQAPEWFTTAPAAAIEKACAKAGWAPKSVDLWEINEAFSVVSIANNQLLGLDPARVNVWGGAVALGHPLGASGARIVVTLLHAMAASGARTGGASLCIGGGEGLAMMVERP